MRRLLVLALLLAGCTEPEDLGARLRRECESIVRAAHPGESADWHDRYLRLCIEHRGRATRF